MPIFIFTVIGFVLIGVVYVFLQRDRSTSSEIQKDFTSVDVVINEKRFSLELADTPKKRRQGLMYRESLPEDGGMLFIFSRNGLHSFWMKSTLIPLDIIWLDEERRIVHIKENAQPCDSVVGALCNSVIPRKLSRYVIELNAGSVGELDLQVGDTISF